MEEMAGSKAENAWRMLAVWFAISILIFAAEKQWSLIIFTLSFGVLYGGGVYRFRLRIRNTVHARRLDRFSAYAAVAVSVSVAEEFYVFALGNRIAVPDIWLDVIIVPAEWLVWFATWYFILSRRYRFSEAEALMTAGFTGIFYEYIGNLFFLHNPVGFLFSIPLAIVIYSAIFVLPMQFMKLEGSKTGFMKYPISVVLPYLLTIPVAIVLYSIFL